jgi:hypothetical protein
LHGGDLVDAGEIRGDIVDRGIERGESEMRPVLQRLAALNTAQSENLPERAGISRSEEKVRKKEVDPEAVKESFKESELDTTSEREPGEGKPAA